MLLQRSRDSSSSTALSISSPTTTPSRSPLRLLPTYHTSAISMTTTDTSLDLTPPLPPRSISSSPAAHSQPPPQALTPSAERSVETESDIPSPQYLQEEEEEPESSSTELYDRLPREDPPPPIPSQAGLEGIYETIPYQKQEKQHQYLHERLVATPRTPSHSPMSWTPELPVRKSPLGMNRTASVGAMNEAQSNQDEFRELRCSSVAQSGRDRRRDSSDSSSSKKLRSSSSRESDHYMMNKERRSSSSSSSEQHHHHHHEEHSGSNRTRSSSSKKHHSSSSSLSKPKDSMSSLFKILVSPSSSRNLSSPHSNNESSKKKKKKNEGKVTTEDGRVKREDRRERKHSSSSSRGRGKDERKETPIIVSYYNTLWFCSNVS